MSKTAEMMVLFVAIAVPVAVASTWAWWFYGPGSLRRRKKARQEVWLNVHAQQIQDKRMRKVYEKAARASATVDRDAFERENRRWD